MGKISKTNCSELIAHTLSISKLATESVLLKKVVLKNFVKFTGSHLCWRLFFNKVAGRLYLFNGFPNFSKLPVFSDLLDSAPDNGTASKHTNQIEPAYERCSYVTS